MFVVTINNTRIFLISRPMVFINHSEIHSLSELNSMMSSMQVRLSHWIFHYRELMRWREKDKLLMIEWSIVDVRFRIGNSREERRRIGWHLPFTNEFAHSNHQSESAIQGRYGPSLISFRANSLENSSVSGSFLRATQRYRHQFRSCPSQCEYDGSGNRRCRRSISYQ